MCVRVAEGGSGAGYSRRQGHEIGRPLHHEAREAGRGQSRQVGPAQ